MIPAEVRVAAATLGTWCLEEAKRIRSVPGSGPDKVVLFYELVGSVCQYFLKGPTC